MEVSDNDTIDVFETLDENKDEHLNSEEVMFTDYITQSRSQTINHQNVLDVCPAAMFRI